ncbi:hypothetical protein GCM10010885_02200 [Alicyclobacillus cellulosilyticus]|uniref:Uncharacterized protein n=1 Tax=Alicyclobacillus cellulosilyticus TaxID=1003997 RepID=A0A917NFK2_9BACL|nr:hypothetical protein [Alicyclobacillus cellulosilyticus]GGI96082.1 hypothetical protein GCM10010885_02200 [Alicyclobacillus cellulosilyticus]
MTKPRARVRGAAAMTVRGRRLRDKVEGSVLLSVLSVCLFATSFLVVLGVVMAGEVEITRESAWERQAYWLARSCALSVLRQVEAGSLSPGAEPLQSPNGTVQVTVTQSSVWSIVVTATTVHAKHTVRLMYDPRIGRVVMWQDAAPG